MSDLVKEVAVREAAQNGAVDSYIAARPQLDNIHNRRIFEAGFQWGWKLKHNEIERKDAAIAELRAALKDAAYRLVISNESTPCVRGLFDLIAKYDK